MAGAREGLSVQLEAFAANTMEYLKQERELLLDGVGVPDIDTDIAGRHCLIVVRGYEYHADLDVLRPYIREFKPVLIGVDGGADALVEAGYTPDLIVGDMDSVTDDVLGCGAEVIVHAYPDGRAPGLARVNRLGVPAKVFPAAATSEDIAMLLADEKGASLLVAVGTHATLVEFLDKGRSGMASTFLTRLKIGGKLVDAKGVSRLYRQGIPGSSLLLLILSAVAAMASAVAVSTAGRAFVLLLAEWWDNLVFSCSASSRAVDGGCRDQLSLPRRVADRGLPLARGRAGARQHRAQRTDAGRAQQPDQHARADQPAATGTGQLPGGRGPRGRRRSPLEAAPLLLDGALTGRLVTVVVLPDADDYAADLVETLELAGAEVAGTVRVTDRFVQPGQRLNQLLDLAHNARPPSVPADELPANSDGVETSAALLAKVLFTRALSEADLAVDPTDPMRSCRRPGVPEEDRRRCCRLTPPPTTWSSTSFLRRPPSSWWWWRRCRSLTVTRRQERRHADNGAAVRPGRRRGARRRRSVRRRQPRQRGAERAGPGGDGLHGRQRVDPAGPGGDRAGDRRPAGRAGRPLRRRRRRPGVAAGPDQVSARWAARRRALLAGAGALLVPVALRASRGLRDGHGSGKTSAASRSACAAVLHWRSPRP
jgi:hypothetical protein